MGILQLTFEAVLTVGLAKTGVSPGTELLMTCGTMLLVADCTTVLVTATEGVEVAVAAL